MGGVGNFRVVTVVGSFKVIGSGNVTIR